MDAASRTPVHAADRKVSETSSTTLLRVSAADHSNRTGLHGRSKGLGIRGKDSWFCEILSLCIHVMLLAVVTAMLKLADGQSLSRLSRWIRPNTTVAIFAVVAKAALIIPVTECISQLKWLHFSREEHPLMDMQRFDHASRGPWGALLFLRYVGRSSSTRLASLGSLIMVANLALDPFMQQIISFQSRAVVSLDTKAVSRVAYAYDTGIFRDNTMFNTANTDKAMQGALLGALYSQVLGGSLFESCPTGKCTWPVVSTLSVCGGCRNVTRDSVVNCTPAGNRTDSPHVVCTYTTPRALIVSVEMDFNAPSNKPMFNSTVGRPAGHNGRVLDHTGASIAQIAVLKVLGDSTSMQTRLQEATVEECHLDWCKTTYHPHLPSSSISAASQVVQEPLSLLRAENGTPIYEARDKTLFLQIYDGNNTKFLIHPVDLFLLRNLLHTLFTASFGTQGVPVEDKMGVADALYQSTNLSETFGRLATGMTSRLQSGRNSTEVAGEAWETEMYVHVQWAWFGLPIVLALLTMVLLAASMTYNRRQSGFLWKSSVLPYFLVSLDQPLPGITETTCQCEMEKLARTAQVQMSGVVAAGPQMSRRCKVDAT